MQNGITGNEVTYIRVIMMFIREIVHLAVIMIFFYSIIKIWRYFSRNPNLRANERMMFLKASLSTFVLISSVIIAAY